ncbi:MAG: hypothetical protein PUF74_10175 [Sodaliphilus pleomorphus]|uniref:hypothetical protein n=1 Tax=Sodaliphilus pleomorphus TaxID=2606626 RepID=UPI0024098E56|nr:hypothetical protein [Sodaliphilus pleomorphus]MDD6475870.1 hypothetical protein [Sodaliphilus pleomorphus]
MKKIVIIEDEPLSAQRIARFVNEYDPEIDVAGPVKLWKMLSIFSQAKQTMT